MLAGGRHGAGEPSSPSPAGRAQGRGCNLASPVVPTPLDLRLQWPPWCASSPLSARGQVWEGSGGQQGAVPLGVRACL